MRNRWVSIVIVAALLAVAGGRELRAAVILFDNLPPVPVSNGLQPVSGTLLAQQFSTDTSTYSLSGVTLWMSTVSAGTPVVGLYSDDGSGTKPGSMLTPFDPLFTPAGGPGATTFSLASAYSLAASTDYWVVLSDFNGGAYQWSYTSSSANSGVGASMNNAVGPVWAPSNIDPYQMQVLGDPPPPPPPAVPEPSTFLLMGGIMAGAFAYRRRKVSGT